MTSYGLREARQPQLVPEFVRRLPPCTDGALAVFDADGTLWVDDVADDFTCWMIAGGRVPGERWPTYLRIYRDDHPAGCRYLLSFYAGMRPAELRRSIDEWWQRHATRRWVWEVVESLRFLHEQGYSIWVVSGTPTDFLLPLREMLPIDEVLGMDFELDAAGRITGRHAGISCAAEGKAEKLRLVGRGRRLAFCCGNGSLDAPMMELAEVAWSIYPNPEFLAHSRARGWPILPRPPDFVEEVKFGTAPDEMGEQGERG